ncbi:putative Nodulation receptor kinase precursor [Hibiscus syriacus]|uniref:Nodulation receptor kinase n=1 Tax=Hibiscus syriacus TaxID=106335 RepID=A0A6A2WF04_HIBSY|nr:putative Nodulation receptor kinase precursor [Hibiscus syriacus]
MYQEAMVVGHDKLANLLKENGANINVGDVGKFSCTAAEQNNLNLFKEIICYGGDVTLPSSKGYTALHVAVCEGNIEIVKFLLEQGANIDKPDFQGWTPKDLVEQQGHEEIQNIFESTNKKKKTLPIKSILEKKETSFLGRFTSKPIISTVTTADGTDGSSRGRSHPRRTTSSFHNSLFRIISAKQNVEKDLVLSVHQPKGVKDGSAVNSARVVVSCPEKGETIGKLVLLPGNFEELLEIGAKKFGIFGGKVMNKGGREIDDMEMFTAREFCQILYHSFEKFASTAPNYKYNNSYKNQIHDKLGPFVLRNEMKATNGSSFEDIKLIFQHDKCEQDTNRPGIAKVSAVLRAFTKGSFQHFERLRTGLSGSTLAIEDIRNSSFGLLFMVGCQGTVEPGFEGCYYY